MVREMSSGAGHCAIEVPIPTGGPAAAILRQGARGYACVKVPYYTISACAGRFYKRKSYGFALFRSQFHNPLCL